MLGRTGLSLLCSALQGSHAGVLGCHCVNADQMETLGTGAQWEVIRSLGALSLEGINVVLQEPC